MKKTIRAFWFFWMLPACSLWAQMLEPVKWASNTSVQEAEVGQTIELVFKATIDQGWYLYSSDFSPELGPIVTTFNFTPDPSYQLLGGIKPVKPKKKFDDTWGGEYTYFSKQGEFKQKVKVLSDKFKVKASVSYQTCSEIDGKCVMFDNDFVFDKLKITAASVEEKVKTEEKPAEETKQDSVLTDNPQDSLAVPSQASTDTLSASTAESGTENLPPPAEEESLLGFGFAAFVAGLLALLTPCVFPMIPMTVSYFTDQKGSRVKAVSKALFYGLSIVGIYTVIGSIVAYVFGATAANFISTHWFPNVLFFVVFLFFAFSFFGMYEITMPSEWSTALDKKADKGGYAGIFFMALTLAVVSFSCTGPIVGSVLIESANGQVLKPIVGMFGFSMAFALPFTLFALFPSWLESMPRSGSWLNSVKVVLGFIELAFAFKFLSVADLVYGWGILDREVYLSIWIAVFSGLTLYLFGILTIGHESKPDHLPVPRLILGLSSLAFVVYMLPGMFGAPLDGLSGFLPPQGTLDFDLGKTASLNALAGKKITHGNTLPKHADRLHLPHGLTGYFDYKEGLAAAKRENKPLFLDFTGHGCVNCRKMEDKVWKDPRVLPLLRDDYIIVSLYVDDRELLPESEWVVSAADGKTKKTLGAVNSDFQITKFKNNAQPYYILLDNNENMLGKPSDYQPDAEKFAAFLENGLK